MVVLEVMSLMAKYVGDKEVLAHTDGGVISNEKYALFAPYIKIINDIQNRIAMEYYPLLTKEVITSNGEVIPFTSLKKTYHKIIKITQNNKPVKFSIIDNGILLNKGEYEIWYNYIPDPVVRDTDELENFSGRVGVRAYALGVAAEHALINCMYDTATFFENKFIDALIKVRQNSSLKYMPKRRWL